MDCVESVVAFAAFVGYEVELVPVPELVLVAQRDPYL
jgi:hypothetical protein